MLTGFEGSGIGLAPKEKGPWAIVVPVALTGETVRVKIVKNDRMHSCGQVVEVLVPNLELRDDSLVQCKYFGTCGGCQYQVWILILDTLGLTIKISFTRCSQARNSWT